MARCGEDGRTQFSCRMFSCMYHTVHNPPPRPSHPQIELNRQILHHNKRQRVHCTLQESAKADCLSMLISFDVLVRHLCLACRINIFTRKLWQIFWLLLLCLLAAET